MTVNVVSKTDQKCLKQLSKAYPEEPEEAYYSQELGECCEHAKVVKR